MSEVIKGIRVKYLFAECPVKPLDVAILMGLALLNENDPDLVLLSPVTELLRNEFRPIVDSKTLRFSSPFDEFNYSSGIDPLIQQADPLVIGIGSAKQRTMV